MKKLLTLLTLALLSIGSAWGADVLIKEIDFTSSAWAAQRTTKVFTAADGTVDGCTATGELAMTTAGEMNFATANMSTSGSNALVIPLEDINGSVKIVVTSTSDKVRFNWYMAEGDASCASRNGTSAGTTEVSYTMTSTATTGTLYLGRRGSSDVVAITKIQVYTADASVTNEITKVTLNGEAISNANLSTLLSTKSLTVSDAFSGLPTVKYTITTKSGGEEIGSAENNVEVVEDGDNYKAAFSFGGDDYTIIFTNVVIEKVLSVTGETIVQLTMDNIAAQAYLSTTTENWSERTVNGGKNNYYNMSSTDREISIKVSGANYFEVFVQNSNAGRTYKIKVGDGEAKTITHGGVDVESSGIVATGTTGEVTITISGGGSSVYPVYIKFNPTVSAEVTSAGYATFSSDKAVDFSDESGLTVYTAKVNDAKTAVTLTEVTSKQVPANTAVVLKGAAGTFTGLAIASADALSDNELQIAASTMNGAAGNIFVLNEVDGVVGFYKLSASGSLLAGKGYLEVDGVAASRSMLDLGGGTTGINMVNGEGLKVSGSEVYYDLQGRRVLYPTKGLYIVNGKKVIIK